MSKLSMSRDLTVSTTVVAIRERNGYSTTECPTCGNPFAQPSRRADTNGVLVYGCVDACHTHAMCAVVNSESAAWHFAAEGMKIRARQLSDLRRIQEECGAV
jgi:hypothetical protein